MRLLISFFMLLCLSSSAHSADRPLKIAVFGDSVSAGVFATEPQANPSPRFFSDMIQVGLNVAQSMFRKIDIDDAKPENLIVWNKISYPMRRENYSYIVGKQNYSLQTRVKKSFGIDLEFVKALFLSGGYEAHDYSIPILDRDVERTSVKPDIIISAYTAMDFLHGKSPDKMASFIRAFFSRITSSYPESDLVVVQLMNTIEGMTGEDKVAAPKNPLSVIDGKPRPLMCSEIMSILKFGEAYNLYPEASIEDIDRAQLVMSEFKKVFAKELDLIRSKQGPYEDFKGRFLYVSEEGVEDQLQYHLAADCIHPNSQGQEILSKMLWEHLEAFIADNDMANYDLDTLPEICEANAGKGFGRKFYCGFGSCAKKSKEVVNRNEREYWCRLAQ